MLVFLCIYKHFPMDFDTPANDRPEPIATVTTHMINIGSASIYIIMEELFKSGKLQKREKLLCFIPESGRFSHCFMLLTVV